MLTFRKMFCRISRCREIIHFKLLFKGPEQIKHQLVIIMHYLKQRHVNRLICLLYDHKNKQYWPTSHNCPNYTARNSKQKMINHRKNIVFSNHNSNSSRLLTKIVGLLLSAISTLIFTPVKFNNCSTPLLKPALISLS